MFQLLHFNRGQDRFCISLGKLFDIQYKLDIQAVGPDLNMTDTQTVEHTVQTVCRIAGYNIGQQGFKLICCRIQIYVELAQNLVQLCFECLG